MAAKREQLVIKTKLSESAGRSDEMLDDIRELVTILPKKQTLTAEERNLLACAFKKEVGLRRKALKTLQKFGISKMTNPVKTKVFHEYKDMVSRELEELCFELLAMIDSKLLPDVSEPVEDIFYHKLKGDYYRYLAEVEENSNKSAEYIEMAKENYEGIVTVFSFFNKYEFCNGFA